MKKALGITALLLMALSGCSRAPQTGFEPPLASDPYQAYQENWQNLELFSGAFEAEYTFSDGDSQRVRADTLIQPGRRSIIDLTYQTTSVAHIMITEEFITLLNHRERYFIREPSTTTTARRMVGIPLLSEEIAALFSGRGFIPERYSQILPTQNEDGSVELELWHSTADLRVEAHIDQFGRLRHLDFINTTTERTFVHAEFLEFRKDSATGIVWPNLLHISLLDRGESLRLSGISVDINNRRLMRGIDRKFVKRERGPRIALDDIPPGPPVLYRNLKVYAEEQ